MTIKKTDDTNKSEKQEQSEETAEPIENQEQLDAYLDHVNKRQLWLVFPASS